MMGASVFPPQKPLHIKNCYEYKHKARRLGAPTGEFVSASYPVGEFSYIDMQKAYAENQVNAQGESTLDNYIQNTYFCPSMSNLSSETDKSVLPFFTFSEATARHGATLAPFLAEEWEKLGECCAYAHMAKGGVAIAHFMDEDMEKEYTKRITAYNQAHGTSFNTELSRRNTTDGAASYFFEKCRHFFLDAEKRFTGDTLENKCLFWLQGESDAHDAPIVYQTKLDILWEKAKTLGFTHFFCLRIDYFGAPAIDNIMRAQEDFVAKHDDAYMLTRTASYFPYAGQDDNERFALPPLEIHQNCRDSFYGYNNQHINEKGFALLAQCAVKNLYRVLVENLPPILEEERVRSLLEQ